VSATPSAQFPPDDPRPHRRCARDAWGELVGRESPPAGGIVGAVDLVEVDGNHKRAATIVVDASGKDHWERLIAAIEAVAGVELIDHDRPHVSCCTFGGKIEQHNRHPLKTPRRPVDGLHAGRRARQPRDRR